MLLERNLSESELGGDGPWLASIINCSAKERQLRIERLRTALSEIDSAVITTIHGFFQQTLREVGLRSPDTAAAEISEAGALIAQQAVRDALVALYAQGDVRIAEALEGKPPSAVEKRVHEILRSLGSSISASVAPQPPGDDVAHEWARLVDRLLQDIAARRHASGQLSLTISSRACARCSATTIRWLPTSSQH